MRLTRLPCAVTLLGLVVTSSVACTGKTSHPRTPAGSASTASSSSTGAAEQLQSEFTGVTQRTLPSVVEIITSTGLGSGVVVDSQGDIVTNNHVVGNATAFKVALPNTATSYRASLVGSFAPDDLAVIRVHGAGNLHPATFGDSSKLGTGDLVMAMGNPLGLASSVTEGIVSALGRTVDEPADADSPAATIPDTIQTSAAINPGNSGGALVNLDAQVVGIPTLAAVVPQNGGAAAPGIGFAIASNMVRNIAQQLITHGKVINSGRAALGVSVQTVTDASGNPIGVGVVQVVPNGPAAKAGIKVGDVITQLGSAMIGTTQQLADVLVQYAPGRRVSVTVVPSTGGSSRTVTVVLGDLATA